jgi:uncharacterized protein YdhG (YjbR/CyaY superfamily)
VSQKSPATVAEYIASLPEPRRSEVEELHALIRETAPHLEPSIMYGMIGYGRFHYRYATGREGDSCILGLAGRKQYVSVYVLGVSEEQRAALPTADIGVGCIRFRRLEGVDREALRRVIREKAETDPAPWGAVEA